MRLLHTTNLTFQEFLGANIPGYAILSHRWSDAEVSYQDCHNGKVRSGPGYAKILEFCKLAQSRGHQWAWIDTCCIDKSSSAELTESINSMWSWYRDSSECYVYLADAPDSVQAYPFDPRVFYGVQQLFLGTEDIATLQKSKWFSRGWTLQELIAPTTVLFYTCGWRFLGSKDELAQVLSSITGIGILYLMQPLRVKDASVATRMSWASDRKTTRAEDVAYCLLGLFDVNMSMLYGEGMEAAFMRLQRKIIKKYDDESIFAWASPRDNSSGPAGMLATSPSSFRLANNVVTLEIPPEQRLQYQMTNKGLELRIPSSLRKTTTDKKLDIRYDKFGWHRGYAPLENKAPDKKHTKRFQLACGLLRQDKAAPIETLEDPAGEFHVIGITLKLTSRGWKRSRCDHFETWPKFEEVDGFSRSLYYVTQGEIPRWMPVQRNPGEVPTASVRSYAVLQNPIPKNNNDEDHYVTMDAHVDGWDPDLTNSKRRED